MNQHGFGVIEALVALLIFSVAALGLAETLVTAQRIRHTSALRMAASQLATSELERFRAGVPQAGAIRVGPFSCAASVEALADYPTLARVRISVDWVDRVPRRLELSTLVSEKGRDD